MGLKKEKWVLTDKDGKRLDETVYGSREEALKSQLSESLEKDGKTVVAKQLLEG